MALLPKPSVSHSTSLRLTPANTARPRPIRVASISIGHFPTGIDAARIGRERAVFSGVSRKLVECETDGLGSSAIQMQLGAVDSNSRPNKIRKMGKLGAHQILHISSMPLVPD